MPGLRRVVLVVLDALGLRMLQEMWASEGDDAFSDLAGAGLMAPLTSVFPSTTDAALMSLSTGRPPAEHGWLAYIMYLREIGMAANAIMLCPMWTRQSDLLIDWGLDPEALVTVPTLASHLAGAGISTAAVLSAHFRRIGIHPDALPGSVRNAGPSPRQRSLGPLEAPAGRDEGKAGP